MLTQFQIQQLTAIQTQPTFAKFCNPLPTVEDWIADAATETAAGVITVLSYNTDNTLTAQRIGQRRVLQSVTV